MATKQHWDRVYNTKSATLVSWYQPEATRSLELIRRLATATTTRLIDVGAGASRLADDLLAAGYEDLTLLDLSDQALAITRARLGQAGSKVRWIAGDVRSVELPEGAYDLWHDRAVLHFLTDAASRAAYRRQLRHAVKPGGHLVIATFALDGPSECSGLPVMRYAPDSLQAELGHDFQAVDYHQETHTTPDGRHQAFLYGSFRRSQ